MCGIIGYIGKSDKALDVVINGLKRLEYRGYDSAGVCFLNGTKLEAVKSQGPIKNLEEKLDMSIKSNLCIGHTRWATHGPANEVNSHPHTSGKVIVVHNGIIENYADIKNELLEKGKTFKSETDTEVVAALLDYYYEEDGDFVEAIEQFKKHARGSYAIAAIVDSEFDRVYAIKNMSPLIIGIGEGENYIASDVPAILDNTNKYIALLDGEYAVIQQDKITLYGADGLVKNAEVKVFSGDASSIDKGEYEHFMLKEIHEEPDVARKILKLYSSKENFDTLPDLTKYKNIEIVACGSAMHAGLVGKYFIEENLGIPVTVELASEFRYKRLFLSSDDVVILISQSGETADTLAALKIAKEHGAHTIGIVNVKESSIAREVDEVIYTLAGSEIAVATTKAYVAQLVVLMLISLRGSSKKLDFDELLKAPVIMEKLINDTVLYEKIAETVKDREDIFYIGRLIDYAISMEGSLKLKEISYIHSDSYAAGELKHGTISLVCEGTPVFAVLTNPLMKEKTISNIKEVKARGAFVVLIASEEAFLEGDYYDEVVLIPSVREMTTVMSVIPLQLIAYHVAKLRGCSIDKPRNLAKSVTVE